MIGVVNTLATLAVVQALGNAFLVGLLILSPDKLLEWQAAFKRLRENLS